MTKLSGIDHLAFITKDISKTIRFYRDLLQMELVAGIGHDGYRHYFFRLGDGNTQVAFFEYEGAASMKQKFPGKRTTEPIGFDHVSFSLGSRIELFDLKDRLEAADIDVHGAVDHGLFWSIYFYDPNNIPLEATWSFMDITNAPAIVDDDPISVAAEGVKPQPNQWPEVKKPTPLEKMTATSGNGLPLRTELLKQSRVKYMEGLEPEFLDLMKNK